MGAGENHRPHPSAHIPPAPCSDGFPVHVEHSPKHPLAGGDGKQVDNPSSYQIAGRVLLAASGAFSGILLALVVLHLCNRGRRGGHSRDSRSRRERRLLRSLAIGAGDDDRDGGAAPSPRGLDPAVLRELPVVVAVAGAAPGDCAVCLAEFEAGEKARALPRCGHRFHVECIDAWFRENSTCPLCRADVEAPDAAAIAQPEVRIDITGDAPAVAAAAAKGGAPAMGRLPSGTDLEKTRRVFASTRSASF